MEITIGSLILHSNSVEIIENGITFSCTQDGNTLQAAIQSNWDWSKRRCSGFCIPKETKLQSVTT